MTLIDGSIFYVYGVIMSVVSIGFYFFEMSTFDGGLRTLLKLLFSISVAWVLSATFIGGTEALARYSDLRFNWFLWMAYFFPFTAFIGFQAMLYKLLDEQ